MTEIGSAPTFGLMRLMAFARGIVSAVVTSAIMIIAENATLEIRPENGENQQFHQAFALHQCAEMQGLWPGLSGILPTIAISVATEKTSSMSVDWKSMVTVNPVTMK